MVGGKGVLYVSFLVVVFLFSWCICDFFGVKIIGSREGSRKRRRIKDERERERVRRREGGWVSVRN